jgi:hypothetical protein
MFKRAGISFIPAILVLTIATAPALAATITVDLSGVQSGKLIDAEGASFAQTFLGQTVTSNGTGITGSPTGTLTLAEAKKLTIEKFDPGVSEKAKSILPPSSNKGPLSVLLDTAASSITFTMGYGNGGTVTIDFFDSSGGIVTSILQNLTNKYAVYNYSGFGIFAGLTIYNNKDPAGLRFMNFSYETAGEPAPEPGQVPLPGALYLFGSALVGLVIVRRRSRATPAM